MRFFCFIKIIFVQETIGKMNIHDHKTLKCQGKVVFEKLVIDGFKRIPKNFQEKEACFMFVNNGSFLIVLQK